MNNNKGDAQNGRKRELQPDQKRNAGKKSDRPAHKNMAHKSAGAVKKSDRPAHKNMAHESAGAVKKSDRPAHKNVAHKSAGAVKKSDRPAHKNMAHKPAGAVKKSDRPAHKNMAHESAGAVKKSDRPAHKNVAHESASAVKKSSRRPQKNMAHESAGAVKKSDRRPHKNMAHKSAGAIKKSDRPAHKNMAHKSAGAVPHETTSPAPHKSIGAGLNEAAAPMRIAKAVARAGLCSRRQAEEWIQQKRLSVNGQLVEHPSTKVSFDDRIYVDGQAIPAVQPTRLWMFHKPAGALTTNADPQGRATIYDLLPDDLPRVISVGRLDFNSEGLLLLTNDGELARLLELPETGWLRRYRVRAFGHITAAQLASLKEGLAVDGIYYGAVDAQIDHQSGSNIWLNIALREGKNREIKKLLGFFGLKISRLIRLSYGPFQLGNLSRASVRPISQKMLIEQLGSRLIKQAALKLDRPSAAD